MALRCCTPVQRWQTSAGQLPSFDFSNTISLSGEQSFIAKTSGRRRGKLLVSNLLCLPRRRAAQTRRDRQLARLLVGFGYWAALPRGRQRVHRSILGYCPSLRFRLTLLKGWDCCWFSPFSRTWAAVKVSGGNAFIHNSRGKNDSGEKATLFTHGGSARRRDNGCIWCVWLFAWARKRCLWTICRLEIWSAAIGSASYDMRLRSLSFTVWRWTLALRAAAVCTGRSVSASFSLR